MVLTRKCFRQGGDRYVDEKRIKGEGKTEISNELLEMHSCSFSTQSDWWGNWCWSPQRYS